MDLCTVIGVFLVGTGAGALSTAALHLTKIRRIKYLLDVASQQCAKEVQNPNPEAEQHKSA